MGRNFLNFLRQPFAFDDCLVCMKKWLTISGILFSVFSFAQNCSQSTSMAELDINNVRASFLNGGDMFWDQPGTGNARYEVPKGSGNNSIFAAALWFGGEDANTGDVLATAQTYRQSNYAYWPGPVGDNLIQDECGFWDKHFNVERSVIERFIFDLRVGNILTTQDVDSSILFWPATGNPHINTESGSITIDLNKDLAPFEDVNNDGIYDPMVGDYPKIMGDQSIWWIMNDVGNQKEFGGGVEDLSANIGLEVQVEAFAFATNDELNDVTFQKYKLVNKGNKTLNNAYVGIWVDVDLGAYYDDYIGCDSSKSLGYAYNGDDYDGVAAGDTLNIWGPGLGNEIIGPSNDGYAQSPASVGFQFCKGLDASHDGIDNDGDGFVDNVEEKLGMTNFMTYQNNSDPLNGNPYNKIVFYNYLKSVWGDGSNISKDDSVGLNQTATQKANFMFNGDPIAGTGWTEENANIPYGDRRFLMSMGPFTFAPGDAQEFIVAIPWAQSPNGAKAALQEMFNVADKVQQVCDADFAGYTSIREKLKKENLGKIYPTEVNDLVNVQLKTRGAHTLEIINSLGAIVHTEILNKSTQINLSNLKAGVYLYKLSNSEGVQTGKLIKR